MRNPFRRKPKPTVPDVEDSLRRIFDAQRRQINAELAIQMRESISRGIRLGSVNGVGYLEVPDIKFRDGIVAPTKTPARAVPTGFTLYDGSGYPVTVGGHRVGYLTYDGGYRRVWAVDGRLLKSFPAVQA